MTLLDANDKENETIVAETDCQKSLTNLSQPTVKKSDEILGAIPKRKKNLDEFQKEKSHSISHENFDRVNLKEPSKLNSILIVNDKNGKAHDAIIDEIDASGTPIRLHIFGIYYVRKGDVFIPDD